MLLGDAVSKLDVCMDFEVIYQKRVRVFHRGFQTPRK